MYKLISVEVNGRNQVKSYRAENEAGEVCSINLNDLLMLTLNGYIENARVDISTGGIVGVGCDLNELPRIKAAQKPRAKKETDGAERSTRKTSTKTNKVTIRGIVSLDSVNAVLSSKDGKVATDVTIKITIKASTQGIRDTVLGSIEKKLKSREDILQTNGLIQKNTSYDLTLSVNELSDVKLIFDRCGVYKLKAKTDEVKFSVDNKINASEDKIERYKEKVLNAIGKMASCCEKVA